MEAPNIFAKQRRDYFDSPQIHGQVDAKPDTDSVVGNPANRPLPTERIVPVQPIAQPQQTQTKPSPVGNTTRGGGQQTPYGQITNMDDLARAMNYTTPDQEEKLRKASVANRRILAVADAMRHIGNIYNTVRYAPAQQFNQPVLEEQSRYERGKAMRDKANQIYLSYQQQKAAQDAKNKQWQMDFNLKVADAARKAGYTEAQIKNMQDRLAQQKAYQEGQLGIGRDRLAETVRNNKERLAETKRANNARISQGNQRISIAKQNLELRKNRGSGGSSGIAPLDTPKGQIIPNGRSYSNQLLQMFDYAKSKGLVQESDVAKRLRELGFGNDQSDNVKRQMVMDLLRTNTALGDYASDRLGWSYGASEPASDWDEYLEEDDDWNDYLAD